MKRTFGFTLVELLVVIGIIALLISMLLPALGRARQQAASVQCLSNLRQQGQAAFIYAGVNGGYLPPPFADSTIYRFNATIADAISRTLKGNTGIFYCPVNTLPAPGTQPPVTPDQFDPPYQGGSWDSTTSGRILYWWVANPVNPDAVSFTLDANGFAQNPTPTSAEVLFRDSNGNGQVKDEYMRHVGQKNAVNIVISTDWSGQLSGTNRGWFFIHGRQDWVQSSSTVAQGRAQYRCWKNNLYGDGHAASVRPDECQWRWGPSGPACW